MLAELDLHPTPDEAPIVVELIKQAMAEAKLPVPGDDDLKQQLEQSGWPQCSGPIVVARGTLPVDDTPAVLQLLNEQPAPSANGAISHYDRHCFVTTAVGQPIARIIHRVEGHDGADVYGKAIPCQHPRDEQFSLGANVGMDGDGSTVVARIAGRLRYDRGKLWVEPLLDIPSDVDFSVGNISFAGDVHIRKNVLDLFRVTSNANINIDGTVEAAHVAAGGNLVVRGGVVGKEKGVCKATGSISVKYATNAILQAGGDVHAHVEISSSKVDCGGVLNAEEGSIIGGVIRALGGVRCGSLGCPIGTPTLVEVGIDHALHEKISEQLRTLRALQKEDRELRAKVTPFAKNIAHLTPEQKKMVAGILHKAKSDEVKVEQMIAELGRSLQSWDANSKPEVHVSKQLYAGVTVRFAEVQCTIKSSLRGPLKLWPRRLEDGIFVFVMPTNGHGHLIASHPLVDDVIQTARRVIQSWTTATEKLKPTVRA
jgi:uncharacterized protein (DUF342 family)